MPCHAKCFTPYYWHVVMEPPWPQLLRLQCEGSWTLPSYRSSISQLCPFYLYDVIQSQLLCSWPQGYQAWTASSPSLCFLICMPGISFSPQSDLKKKKIRSHHFSAKNPPLSPVEPKSLPVSPTFDPCLSDHSTSASPALSSDTPLQSFLERKRTSLTTLLKIAPPFPPNSALFFLIVFVTVLPPPNVYIFFLIMFLQHNRKDHVCLSHHFIFKV